MCGISVIVALQGNTVESPQPTKEDPTGGLQNGAKELNTASQQLDDSLDIIAHRGPDSRGQWISQDRRVALGHVRLAINDLSPEGAQVRPKSAEFRMIAMCFGNRAILFLPGFPAEHLLTATPFH